MIVPVKVKWRLASHKHLGSSLPTISHFRHACAVTAHSARESASQDIFGHHAPTTRQRRLFLPLSPLLKTPRLRPLSSPLTILSLSGCHQLPAPSALPQPLRQPQRSAPPTPQFHEFPPPVRRPPTSHQLLPLPPAMWTQPIPVPVAIANSLQTWAWSVTCESIVERLENQCLEHQPTLAASATIVQTAHAHSLTEWTLSVTCVFTTAEFAAVPTHLAHPAHPPRLAQFRPRRPARPPPAASLLPPSSPPKPTLTLPINPANTVPVHSSHMSAWSVTCESTAEGLASQCLEHQPTLAAFASAALTDPARSGQ
ncbi:hypothetical protein SprV_0501748800 [Sparganum proliferum]